jgi:hypothetical protein
VSIPYFNINPYSRSNSSSGVGRLDSVDFEGRTQYITAPTKPMLVQFLIRRLRLLINIVFNLKVPARDVFVGWFQPHDKQSEYFGPRSQKHPQTALVLAAGRYST